MSSSAPLSALPRPFKPPAPPPRVQPPQTEILCRADAPTTTIYIPSDAILAYLNITDGDKSPVKKTVPLTVGFDASGPHVCLALGDGGHFRTTAPFSQASIQKEIYYNGQRYWRQWYEQEKIISESSSGGGQPSSSQFEEKGEKRKRLLVIGGITILLISLIVVILVAVKKPPTVQDVVHAPPPPMRLQSRTAQIDIARLAKSLNSVK